MHAVGVGAFFIAVVALYFGGEPGWTGWFDDANLVFHEAGHPIYGIFGETLALYGGVLGQLTIPLIVVISFGIRREAAGAAIGGIWFFQNFLNIARYMADARIQELPLAGGGEHDFFNIFTRWDVLDADVVIADRVRLLGWCGMVGVAAWFGWRYWRKRR